MVEPHPLSQAAERRRAAAERARLSRARAAREAMVDRLVVDVLREALAATTPEIDRFGKLVWTRVFDRLRRHEGFTREEALAAVAERVTSSSRDAA